MNLGLNQFADQSSEEYKELNLGYKHEEKKDKTQALPKSNIYIDFISQKMLFN